MTSRLHLPRTVRHAPETAPELATCARKLASLALAAAVLTLAPAARAQLHIQGSQNAMTVTPRTTPDAGLKAQDSLPASLHAGMQTPNTGALRVICSQGTKDGPKIGPDAVTIDLFAGGKTIKTYHTHLDANARLELRDLPLDRPFQPIITVFHNGAEEELVGPPMHRMQPAVELDMPLFEPTADKPHWTSGIRHVTAEPVLTDGRLTLHLVDMMGGFNPTDRAWLGDNGTTLTLQLPSDAGNIQLGQGLAEANPKITGTTITRNKPMLPGPTEYDCGYSLPVTNGAATLTFTLPADTTLFALYLPATVHIDSATGLTVSPSSNAAGLEGRQLLVAKSLKAGQILTVNISNITPPPAPPPAATPKPIDTHTDLHLPRPKEPNP